MTSTGYGDISAHTTIGRSIALGAMLFGLLLYGYCLSSIAATLANNDTPRFANIKIFLSLSQIFDIEGFIV